MPNLSFFCWPRQYCCAAARTTSGATPRSSPNVRGVARCGPTQPRSATACSARWRMRFATTANSAS
eukprot:13711246-Alexandrium_andersonii.AAC.1